MKATFRSLFLTQFLISFALFGFAQKSEISKQTVPADYGYKVKIGQQMPEIELKLTNGKTLTSTVYGKLVQRLPQGNATYRKPDLAKAQKQPQFCTYRN